MRGTENNHHMCWERNEWSERGLSRQVRNLPAFQMQMPVVTHKLLHEVFKVHNLIPEVPRYETLEEMRAMAPHGLRFVMDRLEDPIVENFEHQLVIASIAPARARQKLENKDYEVYGVTRERCSSYAGSIGGVSTRLTGILLGGQGVSGFDPL